MTDAVDVFLERLEHGVPPASGPDGPVKELRHLGDDVDLASLPIPIHAEKDGGPFLTSAVGVARDGESGLINTGIYRMMVLDRNHLTVGTGTDLHAIIQEAHAAGRIVEFAAVVGHHPAFQGLPKRRSSHDRLAGDRRRAHAGAPGCRRRRHRRLARCRRPPRSCWRAASTGITRPDGPFGEVATLL